MIHHYLNEFEIQKLTQLHKVNFCGTCKYCRLEKCIPRNIIVNNNISCEKFINEPLHSWIYPLKFME